MGVQVTPERHDPLLYHLRSIKWMIFGTLTWRNSHRRWGLHGEAHWGRCKDFLGVIVQTCKELGLRPRNLRLYYTEEYGLRFADSPQMHFHFLIARDGLGDASANKFAETMTRWWENQFQSPDSTRPGLGKAEIKPYDQARGDAGVKYCLKREFDDHGQQRERYDYVSPKLFEYLKRQQETN